MKRFLPVLVLAVAPLLVGAGCEWDDDDDDDFEPAEGKGAIVVDNNSADDIAVFIDGLRVSNVDDFTDEAYELEPGVYRIVLDQRDGDRSYRDDVDVLENRRTVLDVSAPTFDDDYDVRVFID